MEKVVNQFRIHSRVSAHAVASGILCNVALMMLSLLLAAAFGFWTFDTYQMSQLGAVFWLWALLSWVVISYVSGYVSAEIGHSTSDRDGGLHGFITWCGSTVVLVAALTGLTGNVLSTLSTTYAGPLLWGMFIASSIALVTGILGGMNACELERRLRSRSNERMEREDRSHGGSHSSYEPAVQHPR